MIMILGRLDKLEGRFGTIEKSFAQVSKMSTQTYSSVVELHPRTGQIAQNVEKMRACMNELLQRLDAEQQEQD